MTKGTDNRQRAVAALIARSSDQEAVRLLDHLGDADRACCEPLVTALRREERGAEAMELIVRHLLATERFSSLAEVHPAWILEHLREEPPRVVGIILRSLPSQHVRYLVQHLPPHIREAIPGMVESFAVPAPVLDVIRRRFERHFLPMGISRRQGRYDFSHLYFLKGKELETVLEDIGLSELAIAFSGLSGRALRAVYNRMDLKDAKRLKQRMQGFGEISPELFRQARMTVLEIEEERLGPKRMLRRLGLAALACALDDEHGRLARLIQQKLEPHDGYFLKRLRDETRPRHDRAVAAERHAIILRQIAQLAGAGRIDPIWSGFAPEGEAKGAATASGAGHSDETQTAHQLA